MVATFLPPGTVGYDIVRERIPGVVFPLSFGGPSQWRGGSGDGHWRRPTQIYPYRGETIARLPWMGVPVRPNCVGASPPRPHAPAGELDVEGLARVAMEQ